MTSPLATICFALSQYLILFMLNYYLFAHLVFSHLDLLLRIRPTTFLRTRSSSGIANPSSWSSPNITAPCNTSSVRINTAQCAGIIDLTCTSLPLDLPGNTARGVSRGEGWRGGEGRGGGYMLHATYYMPRCAHITCAPRILSYFLGGSSHSVA